ncbi:DUF4166 domain-containing protein [Epibacterium sp. MM17-32]|uniref:SDR family oxidoreductase n=1 Tax=Epibacterium sp. MM17-32 TaxID=2917734 RepID=UPI001EF4F972|nr:SDR family oxidoreductase [Epibacterium sp. MM17-32]MCG7629093.1 DUF4166 domain-containing protein [Epibacterium sp. MM17-32]
MNNRVLVLGGYGVFGGRLSAALARQGGIEVLVAGRSLHHAEAHCAVHGGTPISLDRSSRSLATDVAALRPRIVIDAAGPFQAYGDAPYALAHAALACGAHYIDLSDDARFSAGISELDTDARRKGCVVLSGASSVPGLSSAAVKDLAAGLTQIDRIESAILPGNRAPRGLSVIHAILAQVGQPIPITRGSLPAQVTGWSGTRRETLSLPGRASLHRWAAHMGAPDLQLFPGYFNARTVLFRAGLELPLLHHGLRILGLPVRMGWIRSLAPLAPMLRRCAQAFETFGSDRGGMSVELRGRTTSGQYETRRWTLIAGAGDGPEVPTLVAQALCRRLLCRDRPAADLPAGARACLCEVSLADILAAARGLDIQTATQTTPIQPVFRTALGSGFAALPAAVQALHDTVDASRWQGTATVTTGAHPLARIIRRLIGFPAAGQDVPVQVDVLREGAREIWVRRFGHKRFRSILAPFGTPGDGTVTERFGPLCFVIALRQTAGRLAYPVTRGWCLGLPLPRRLLPRSDAVEYADPAGAFCFDVAVRLPLIGLIVRYRGRLTPTTGPLPPPDPPS